MRGFSLVDQKWHLGYNVYTVTKRGKQMEYKIVESPDADKLTKQVNDLLAQGWELQGGVSANVSLGSGHRAYFFAQALVRKL